LAAEPNLAKILDRLEKHWYLTWRGWQPSKSTAATAREIAGFEQENGVSFPADFRDYLLRFNGIEEDPELFCFWPIGKIRRLDFATSLLQPEKYFLFADFLIESIYYAIYLGDDPFFRNRVVLPDYPGSPTIAPTFTEFLELYLRDDKKIYGG